MCSIPFETFLTEYTIYISMTQTNATENSAAYDIFEQLQSSSSTLPSPLSEAEFYYAGLPSAPVLVARTGTTPWKAPTGPEAYRQLKELRAVGNHALEEVWEGNLAPELHALLDSMEVKWTSTDVVRIGNAEESSAPVILWIGVMPTSLTGDDGVVVASKCRELLVQSNITDVDVEIRESVVTRSAGPKLLTSTYSSDPTVSVREPFTTTLGLPICAQSTPWAGGTGGFFITEGGNTKRLLLVTARHVVFTPDKNKNDYFQHRNDSQPRYNITLFSDAAFDKHLKSIQAGIRDKPVTAQFLERCIKAVEGKDDPAANKERQEAQAELDEAKEAMEELNTFYQDVSTHWVTSESRVLGHVILSPPISVGSSSEGYTEDWAVIEIDASKVNVSNFNGNAIDLGTHISASKFTRMMYPNPKNPRSFMYPVDRLLRLQGTIPDEEMRHPPALDLNGDPCLMVIKRGNTTGLTVGRANNICSFARYYEDDKAETSKEWAILPFDSKSGAFSAKGDSGSVIIDGLGRIGGFLTGGAGAMPSLDITYATPISFLLKRMQDNGLHKPNINPVLTT
ncbi:hypothetical protein EV421DRAFT_551705 [Armillaria borealis]|uniref:Serine protease n=1 Tax=Armillaria borealis TaxID=47425 RepID=A0AA39JK86_9AGAR|nr:hypothetical protein EV421DRAFT_551705 [Armillaria borealis]